MIASSSNFFYQVGASLPVDAPSYVKRQADEEFYQKLQAGDFCYVFNSRQMGKSSLRVQTMKRLQEKGTVCVAIDLTASGKVTEEQWYGGIVHKLVKDCQLKSKFGFNWQTWWSQNREILSPVQCLSLFFEEVLLINIQEPIVIFIDEIDKVLSQDFSLDDFFALIRFFQNQRVDSSIFKRLTFALLGVATPGDLIADKTQTPFNIGSAIELYGFQIHEVESLIQGLEGKFDNPQGVMSEILDWTGGQPFLSQKLCQFMVEESHKDNPRCVEEVVKSRVIENWESQDEPEHLRTIRDRILSNEQRAGYLLELYQRIQQDGEVTASNGVESSELRLSGLVVKRQGKLRVYNQVYQQVFHRGWVEVQLRNLRPYSEAFRFWVVSKGKDESRLLRGKALVDAEKWAQDKNLSYQDKQFLAASREKEIQEKIAVLKNSISGTPEIGKNLQLNYLFWGEGWDEFLIEQLFKKVRNSGVSEALFLNFTVFITLLSNKKYEKNYIQLAYVLKVADRVLKNKTDLNEYFQEKNINENTINFVEREINMSFEDCIKKIENKAFRVNQKDKACMILQSESKYTLFVQSLEKNNQTSQLDSNSQLYDHHLVQDLTIDSGCAWLLTGDSSIQLYIKGEFVANYRAGEWKPRNFEYYKKKIGELADKFENHTNLENVLLEAFQICLLASTRRCGIILAVVGVACRNFL